MNAQVYSALGTTDGRRKSYLEWNSLDLSYKVSLTCGGNAKYYESVNHPILTGGTREHPGNF